MGSVGYVAIALFVVLWALSALNYRRKNYDSLTL
jgi:high-affinity nickel-transport protein